MNVQIIVSSGDLIKNRSFLLAKKFLQIILSGIKKSTLFKNEWIKPKFHNQSVFSFGQREWYPRFVRGRKKQKF